MTEKGTKTRHDQARLRSPWFHVVSVSMSLLFSTAFAAKAVQTPAIWPYLPRAPMELALKVLRASNQEQVADAEFLGIWVPCFLILLAMGHLVRQLAKRLSR